LFITDLARYLISCLTSLSCNTLILIYQNLSHRIFRLVCPNRKQTLTRSVEQSLSLSQQNRVPLNVRRLLAPETYLIDPRELQNWVTVEVANWGAEIGQTLVLWKAPPPPILLRRTYVRSRGWVLPHRMFCYSGIWSCGHFVSSVLLMIK